MFLPSECARLVLGYCEEKGYHKSSEALLQEVQELEELKYQRRKGKAVYLRVGDLTLTDFFEDYSQAKDLIHECKENYPQSFQSIPKAGLLVDQLKAIVTLAVRKNQTNGKSNRYSRRTAETSAAERNPNVRSTNDSQTFDLEDILGRDFQASDEPCHPKAITPNKRKMTVPRKQSEKLPAADRKVARVFHNLLERPDLQRKLVDNIYKNLESMSCDSPCDKSTTEMSEKSQQLPNPVQISNMQNESVEDNVFDNLLEFKSSTSTGNFCVPSSNTFSQTPCNEGPSNEVIQQSTSNIWNYVTIASKPLENTVYNNVSQGNFNTDVTWGPGTSGFSQHSQMNGTAKISEISVPQSQDPSSECVLEVIPPPQQLSKPADSEVQCVVEVIPPPQQLSKPADSEVQCVVQELPNSSALPNGTTECVEVVSKVSDSIECVVEDIVPSKVSSYKSKRSRGKGIRLPSETKRKIARGSECKTNRKHNSEFTSESSDSSDEDLPKLPIVRQSCISADGSIPLVALPEVHGNPMIEYGQDTGTQAVNHSSGLSPITVSNPDKLSQIPDQNTDSLIEPVQLIPESIFNSTPQKENIQQIQVLSSDDENSSENHESRKCVNSKKRKQRCTLNSIIFPGSTRSRKTRNSFAKLANVDAVNDAISWAMKPFKETLNKDSFEHAEKPSIKSPPIKPSNNSPMSPIKPSKNSPKSPIKPSTNSPKSPIKPSKHSPKSPIKPSKHSPKSPIKPWKSSLKSPMKSSEKLKATPISTVTEISPVVCENQENFSVSSEQVITFDEKDLGTVLDSLESSGSLPLGVQEVVSDLKSVAAAEPPSNNSGGYRKRSISVSLQSHQTPALGENSTTSRGCFSTPRNKSHVRALDFGSPNNIPIARSNLKFPTPPAHLMTKASPQSKVCTPEKIKTPRSNLSPIHEEWVDVRNDLMLSDDSSIASSMINRSSEPLTFFGHIKTPGKGLEEIARRVSQSYSVDAIEKPVSPFSKSPFSRKGSVPKTPLRKYPAGPYSDSPGSTDHNVDSPASPVSSDESVIPFQKNIRSRNVVYSDSSESSCEPLRKSESPKVPVKKSTPSQSDSTKGTELPKLTKLPERKSSNEETKLLRNFRTQQKEVIRPDPSEGSDSSSDDDVPKLTYYGYTGHKKSKESDEIEKQLAKLDGTPGPTESRSESRLETSLSMILTPSSPKRPVRRLKNAQLCTKLFANDQSNKSTSPNFKKIPKIGTDCVVISSDSDELSIEDSETFDLFSLNLETIENNKQIKVKRKRQNSPRKVTKRKRK